MVRAVLACVWCRRQKIKCVHDGTGPCRTCVKAKRTAAGECVLTGPPFQNMYSPRHVRTQSSQEPGTAPGRVVDENGLLHEFRLENESSTTATNLATSFDQVNSAPAGPTARKSISIKLATTFKCTFPELAFLNLASSATGMRTISGSSFEPLLEEALTCLCTRFLDCNVSVVPSTEQIEDLVVKVRNDLLSNFNKAPTITTVQTYLVMSMYEWGSGNGYLSWMYSGMATRMIQSLQAMKRDNDSSDLAREVENRTFWSCFVMDRLIFSGATQPLALPFDKLNINLPVGEQDFVFGFSSQPRVTAKQLATAEPALNIPSDPDHYYSVLVRGFDIWAKVLELVVSGGRRQPEMSKPNNCPWVKGSPWNTIHESLEKWRGEQHNRLKFPQCAIVPHVSLGQGEAFAFVNLIYFVSTLFLHREYIPFIPTKESRPSGPVDPPLLEETAPDGWWDRGSAELFHAASCITRILEDLEMCGSSLFSPFAGFCAFSAAIMNLYVGFFPRMNLNRTANGAELAKLNIQYLDQFQRFWKMGFGWHRTVEHTRLLYQRIHNDHSRFHGKTRADFESLEASIHDYTGTSPVNDPNIGSNDPLSLLADASSQALLNSTDLPNGESAAGQSGQHQMPVEGIASELTGDAVPDPTNDSFWNEPWPLWGDHQFMPFAIGGSPFDSDFNVNPHVLGN